LLRRRLAVNQKFVTPSLAEMLKEPLSTFFVCFLPTANKSASEGNDCRLQRSMTSFHPPDDDSGINLVN
jgi:hypothetical protein